MRLLSLICLAMLAGAAVAAEGEAEARKALVGTWVGRVDEGATGHKLTFTADRISGTRDEKQYLGEGSFTVDRKQKPWKMDAVGTKGPQRGRRYLGIYMLEGETLKWCVSTPGNDRPTEFATKDSQFLLILKKQK